MTAYEIFQAILKCSLLFYFVTHYLRGLYNNDHKTRVESLITSLIFLLLFLQGE